MSPRAFGLVGLFCALAGSVAPAMPEGHEPARSTGEVTVDIDGTVNIPAYALPLSTYMSEAAKQAYIKARLTPPPPPPPPGIEGLRASIDRSLAPLLTRAKAVYSVSIAQEDIGGVRTNVVTPRSGVAANNRDRVLINLHGGGLQYGTPTLALLESIPIAAVGKIKVIAVDYRQAPEAHFPAASQDVAAVYQQLLKHYKPQNIGIYGCSSGGLLTAMTVTWLQKEKLPSPGAIGIFCGGANDELAGDSSFSAVPLIQSDGARLLPPPAHPNTTPEDPYLGSADRRDPLVAPVLYPKRLAKFPPTLLITGTRDVALSDTVHTQTELVKAGVEADLHVWEGMWHSFFVDVDLPESKEVYAVVAKFFDAHLGRTR